MLQFAGVSPDKVPILKPRTLYADADMVPVLVELVRDEDMAVQIAGAWGLRLGPPAQVAVPDLIPLLHSPLALVVSTDRLVQRDRRRCSRERFLNVLQRQPGRLGELFLRRLAAELDLGAR